MYCIVIILMTTVFTSRDCSDESCPIMSGGPKYEYLWQVGHTYYIGLTWWVILHRVNMIHTKVVTVLKVLRVMSKSSVWS